MMPDPKQHITDLAFICFRKGLRQVVISPGSRSAPLIRAFVDVFGDDCISIVDERSAAYFALGMAAFSQIPVVLVCTSGTAVLNYAPALAEAFYQHVPLLAITADRPHEWIHQQANQTIRQPDVYSNYVKASYELPQRMTTDDDVWYAHRIINESINLCLAAAAGPVHLNVPLTEPLYETLPQPSHHIRIIQQVNPELQLGLSPEMTNEWQHARRIMIIHGQDHPRSEATSLLASLADDERIIVFAENIANVPGNRIIMNSSLVLGLNRSACPANPDLILHSGGQVVSAALGNYLRALPVTKCWRIGNDSRIIDTFKQATHIIPLESKVVYRTLLETPSIGMKSDYAEQWMLAAAKANIMLDEKVGQMPFSDIRVFKRITSLIPEETLVMIGNSSVIRYTQFFALQRHHRYYANRGVSGIDGCISTAAGIAYLSKNLTLAITGDQGFLYDSNALWNRELPANLRIVVLNNGGGGIFHMLKGPSEMKGFKKYMEADHPVKMGDLAAGYHADYFYAQNETDIEKQWERFIHGKKRPAIFEIKTDAAISASSFRQIMNSQ
jgi:2-succinyl-5-enolpyruvyl-6-hydroxy-3-cyclohexene-1-carboxylate synthase